MGQKMETTIMGYIGTTTWIHSFIPSYPKVSRSLLEALGMPKLERSKSQTPRKVRAIRTSWWGLLFSFNMAVILAVQ